MRVLYSNNGMLRVVDVYKAEEMIQDTVKLSIVDCDWNIYVSNCVPKQFIYELYDNGCIDITSGYKVTFL